MKLKIFEQDYTSSEKYQKIGKLRREVHSWFAVILFK